MDTKLSKILLIVESFDKRMNNLEKLVYQRNDEIGVLFPIPNLQKFLEVERKICENTNFGNEIVNV